MPSDVLSVLRARENWLLAELQQTPLSLELAAVRRMILIYVDATDRSRVNGETASMQIAPRARRKTQAREILDGAEAYLRAAGRRAQTPEIVAHPHGLGIVPSADVAVIRAVASCLSTAKTRFNNVRGSRGGYGLAAWGSDNVASMDAQNPALRPESV